MTNIGILDPDGINPNPINNNPYSDKYKELSNKWRNFPAYEKAGEIIESIKNNRVILVTSGTGSGKTVLIPKYCLHAFDYKAKIAITLPKQIIAKSAAEFAALTLDVKLGKDVGYQYRGSDKSGRSKDNKLLYATDGSIVAKLLRDPLLSEYDAVIIDEAHERKVQIDFLLYLLKNVVKNRPEFKLIIMSATINVDIFKKYYSDYSFTHINIGGKTNYPIESIFLKSNISTKDYIDKGISIIKKILKETKDGDILFFVTSVSETIDVCEKLEDGDFYCSEIYSGMDKSKQIMAQDRELYKEATGKGRKIVISTNVAESSLTIDGIKYVIDSGLELFNYYDPKIRANVLVKQFITHAQAKQRMGRAGRTEKGICYHLYDKETFEKNMKRFPEPNIRTSNLYGEFLQLLLLESVNNVDKLKEILKDFIEPPDKKYIDESLLILKELSLVKSNELTSLGNIIANLRTDPMEGLTIWASYHMNCGKEVIAIISMINATKGNMTELFNLPSDIADENSDQLKYLTKKFNKAKKTFNSKYGDHLSLLKMFNTFLKKRKNEDRLKEWIYKFFLKRSVFEKAFIIYKRYYRQFRGMMNKHDKIDIENIMKYNTAYRIMGAFMYGYRVNVGKVSKKSVSTVRIKNVDVNKYSFLDVSSDKKLILYYELFKSTKVSMNIVSSIPKKSIELYDIIIDRT
jgi:HrpA-like RNA helicase